MTLPDNADFANRELSIEELEAIAAGGFWSTVEGIAGDALKGLATVAVYGGFALLGLAALTVIGHAGGSSQSSSNVNRRAR